MKVFRRNRTNLLILLIALPVAWFAIVGFTVIVFGDGDNSNVDHNIQPRFENLQQSNQPVLERLDFDRIRYQATIREEARLRAEKHDFHNAENNGQRDWLNVAQGVGKFVGRIKEIAGQKMGLMRKWNVGITPSLSKRPNPDAPGELGRAVNIRPENLSPEEKARFDEGWKKNAFNQYASDMISLHRSLPDVRDADCKNEVLENNLPHTSVIICFHNEGWTVLLRTIHSILDRSPPYLIKEIVLVDDYSDLPHLKKALSDYVEKLQKIKIVRTKRREGLIRARLLGASVAVGKVLTYLDSHCECTEGWLEPMLSIIAQNESNVVTPVIDVIDDETLRYQYSTAKSTSVGGFDWNLQFSWHAIPDYENKRRKSALSPLRSPTMAGGLFAISKNYFEYLGSYDPGMDIWGGENLELSFRVWMCGGNLFIHPCSHVGHIFRKRSPYSWKTGVNVVKKNSVRVAEVWMDEYKNYYYERFNHDLGNYGDVSSRKALRQRLKCQSFKWYIENIYPDLFIPGDAIASGEIRNYEKPLCLDSSVEKSAYNKPIKMWSCHSMGGNQYWMLSKQGEIRRDEGCFDYAGDFVMIYPCHSMKGNQEWSYDSEQRLYHVNSNMCIEMSSDGQKIHMAGCSKSPYQKWKMRRKQPDHAA